MKKNKSIKSVYFAFRLTPNDMTRINIVADRLGVSPSRLVRLLVLYISPNAGPVGQSTRFFSWVRRLLGSPVISF